MTTSRISRYVEFDSGHRVPDHASKCQNPHGHRYRVEAWVEGEVVAERGRADDGMVLDFGALASCLEELHDQVDHGFMVADYDTAMLAALAEGRAQGWKVVEYPFPPTAENLAMAWAGFLDSVLPEGTTLTRLDVWETTKSRASWVREDGFR